MLSGDRSHASVYFVHWSNGPGDPTRRTGWFHSYNEAVAEACAVNSFNPECRARVVRYDPAPNVDSLRVGR